MRLYKTLNLSNPIQICPWMKDFLNFKTWQLWVESAICSTFVILALCQKWWKGVCCIICQYKNALVMRMLKETCSFKFSKLNVKSAIKLSWRLGYFKLKNYAIIFFSVIAQFSVRALTLYTFCLVTEKDTFCLAQCCSVFLHFILERSIDYQFRLIVIITIIISSIIMKLWSIITKSIFPNFKCYGYNILLVTWWHCPVHIQNMSFTDKKCMHYLSRT